MALYKTLAVASIVWSIILISLNLNVSSPSKSSLLFSVAELFFVELSSKFFLYEKDIEAPCLPFLAIYRSVSYKFRGSTR
jgi:hypothetical protein